MINLDGLFNGKAKTQPVAEDAAGAPQETAPPGEDRVTTELRRLTARPETTMPATPAAAPVTATETAPETAPAEDGLAALARAASAVTAQDGPVAAPPLAAPPEPPAAGSPASPPSFQSDPSPGAGPAAGQGPSGHGAAALDGLDLSAMAASLQARGPAAGGRVRTRLLGFGAAAPAAPDPIARTDTVGSGAATHHAFPTGWIVVIDGPGRGTAFSVGTGVAQIGRGEDQAIRLDFGDASISRSNHAAIAYDEEMRQFFVGHGGKANLVRRNDRPVLATEPLEDRDRIRIGETTLLFVAFCGASFDWRGDCGDD